FAKSAFGDSYGYIWWIPLHNFLLRYVWAAFGAEGFPGMMLTLVALFVLLLFYGLFRAVYYAETATPALPAGGTHAPGIGPASVAGALFARAANATPPPPPPPLIAPNATGAPHAPQAAKPTAPTVVGNRSPGIFLLPGRDLAARLPT